MKTTLLISTLSYSLKTILMKNLIFLIALTLSINISAQNELKNSNIFVRVFDLQGKKINKGKIFSISETSLQLIKKGENIKINFSSIGSIKTKRSAGNNLLIGAGVGATTLGIIMARPAEDGWSGDGYSASEGALGGVVLGGISGTAIGGITILFKNSKSYLINGDLSKWKAFQDMITKKRIE